jgi:hypothetical protein
MSGERPSKAAGQVKPGDWLWYPTDDGKRCARHVVRTRIGGHRHDPVDRDMVVWFDDSYIPGVGDENQTVYLATETEIAEARVARMRGQTP